MSTLSILPSSARRLDKQFFDMTMPTQLFSVLQLVNIEDFANYAIKLVRVAIDRDQNTNGNSFEIETSQTIFEACFNNKDDARSCADMVASLLQHHFDELAYEDNERSVIVCVPLLLRADASCVLKLTPMLYIVMLSSGPIVPIVDVNASTVEEVEKLMTVLRMLYMLQSHDYISNYDDLTRLFKKVQ